MPIRHNVLVLNDVVVALGASVLGDSVVCADTATEWFYAVVFELCSFVLVHLKIRLRRRTQPKRRFLTQAHLGADARARET